MVCKEEVVAWFQNLRGSKRIEAMSCFLNMCYPLELRFYGTCLEDLGRKDFYVFKDEEVRANDISEILKIRNIHDQSTRSKLIVVLSLLNSSNTICAKELFKVLSEEIKIEILASMGVLSNFKLLEHYLLVLTLAQHHPAFSFEQQIFLTNLGGTLESYVTELCSKMKCEESYLPSSYMTGRVLSHNMHVREVFSNVPHAYRHTPPRCSESQHNQVQITSLKVKPPHKKMCLRIRVAWENNKITDAFKTPHDLLVFHQKLVQLFPSEAKSNNQDKCIPPLPHVIGTWNKQHNITDSVAISAAEYIQQLNSRLPSYIIESEFFRNFFMPSSYPNRAALARNNRIADSASMDVPPRSSRLRSLTIYNSQMSDNSPRHRSENRQKILPVSSQRKHYENGSSICSRSSPMNSPIESPLSSPYASPLNSETNSRAPSPWNVAPSNLDRTASCVCPESPGLETIQAKELTDQWDSLRNYKIEELQAMPIQELESLGILKEAGTKLSKDSDPKSLPNGIVGCYIPKSALLLKSGSLPQTNSNDSSPVCSEYSSPPQSPSPGETCNQSSSLSSGNEENTEKRPLSKALSEMCKVDESEPAVLDSPLKRTDDDSVCMKSNVNRSSVSVIPFAVPYSNLTQMPPPQSLKPAYLPITCRTNNAPQHLSPGAVVFDNQFSRVPLPSALTFIPGPQRPHAATPDRVLSPSSLPISTVSPFPVVTSGCTTVPSATCSITTHRSSNVTGVTHSGASSTRYTPKNSNLAREGDIVSKPVQQSDTPYATGYILNTSSPLTAVSCSCFTTNSARPSPAPSPSILSPGAAPQPSAVPVSMSYLGMPYLFHSIPFLQAQTPANGFVPQPGMANSGQGFSYTLPNGMTAISPELIYPGQTFTLQSPSTQSNPCPVATPASQCYGAFPQTSAVPIKLMTCYNCGKVGHRGPECKEQTMDDLNKSGKYQLNFNPVPKISDSHE